MNTLLRRLVSLIIITSLSACNESSSSPTQLADTTKPTITVENKNFIDFIQLPLNEAGFVSFGPFNDTKITAQDDSGIVNLSIVDVKGLDKSQVTLNSDNSISFNKISHSTNLGIGIITLRAIDKSANYTDSEVFFAVTTSEMQTPKDITLGKTTTIKYFIMPDIDQVEITQPLKSTGISTSAYLANNELFINITANNNATTEEDVVTSELTLRATKLESYTKTPFHIRLLPN